MENGEHDERRVKNEESFLLRWWSVSPLKVVVDYCMYRSISNIYGVLSLLAFNNGFPNQAKSPCHKTTGSGPPRHRMIESKNSSPYAPQFIARNDSIELSTKDHEAFWHRSEDSHQRTLQYLRRFRQHNVGLGILICLVYPGGV